MVSFATPYMMSRTTSKFLEKSFCRGKLRQTDFSEMLSQSPSVMKSQRVLPSRFYSQPCCEQSHATADPARGFAANQLPTHPPLCLRLG